ncbi:MAG: NAD(P)/FAD-dependent oxidoreductase [Bacteroidales bacterium]|nr:NAD(P)/FAD-dependent oxidoreductase [Bacteroidales bacterium]
MKKIVIIGCGFGGLTLAKRLSKQKVEILLIDKNNYHTFQPLLYQVATGGLEAENIAYPVRKIFRNHKNVIFRMSEVFSVNEETNTLTTNIGEITYDYLVIATGTTNNFFNFEKVKDKILPLKTLIGAFNIRSFFMQNLERSLLAKNAEDQAEIINVAVIGGGPAGIEVAGAIAEMKKYVLPLDFPELDLSTMNIVLFEASDRLLAVMSDPASKHAYKYLKNMGITIKLSTPVKDYDGKHLILDDGSTFKTDTVIWTAGVKPVKLSGLKETHYHPGNRLKVDEFNRLSESKTIFAIGDVAAYVSPEHPKGLPMLAPVAIQQAKLLANNFKLMWAGKELVPFTYKNKGVMATIGRKRAVVDFPKWKFHGLFAWFIWMFIHIMSLIGFRNRVVTLINWSLSYFNYDKPLGIIIPLFKRND